MEGLVSFFYGRYLEHESEHGHVDVEDGGLPDIERLCSVVAEQDSLAGMLHAYAGR